MSVSEVEMAASRQVRAAVHRPVKIVHRSAGAVVIHEGQCLVLRRGREWVFPKGHLEQGETAQQAAVREGAEETGVEIAIDEWLGVTRYEFSDRRHGIQNLKTVDWFAAHPVGGALRLEPVFADGGYIAFEEALQRLAHEADRDIARRAFGLPVDDEDAG